jgi:hypothetical protein
VGDWLETIRSWQGESGALRWPAIMCMHTHARTHARTNARTHAFTNAHILVRVTVTVRPNFHHLHMSLMGCLHTTWSRTVRRPVPHCWCALTRLVALALDRYAPHADFWVASLWAKLMGTKVLSATVVMTTASAHGNTESGVSPSGSHAKRDGARDGTAARGGADSSGAVVADPAPVLRAYAHCGRAARTVTLALANVGAAPSVNVSISSINFASTTGTSDTTGRHEQSKTTTTTQVVVTATSAVQYVLSSPGGPGEELCLPQRAHASCRPRPLYAPVRTGCEEGEGGHFLVTSIAMLKTPAACNTNTNTSTNANPIQTHHARRGGLGSPQRRSPDGEREWT